MLKKYKKNLDKTNFKVEILDLKCGDMNFWVEKMQSEKNIPRYTGGVQVIKKPLYSFGEFGLSNFLFKKVGQMGQN